MGILKSLSEDHPQFYNDFIQDGYAFLSKKKAVLPRYYPSDYPVFREIPIEDIEVDDHLIIRAFFKTVKGKRECIDSGLITICVEAVEDEYVWGNVETLLPSDFPVQKGDTLQLTSDEILDFDTGDNT